jgi:hypothetical protein
MLGRDVGAGNKVFPDVGMSYRVLIGLVLFSDRRLGLSGSVARGLAPVRLRSGRKASKCCVSGGVGLQISGPLRAPTGASSLATEGQ